MRSIPRRMLSLITGLGALVGLAASAYAADGAFDATTYFPSVDGYGILSLDTSRIYQPFRFGGSLDFHFNDRSLEVTSPMDGTRKLVGANLKMDMTAAFAFCRYYEFGLDLPVMLGQSASGLMGDQHPHASAFGDMRLHNKFAILDRDRYPVGLAAIATLVVPTGAPESYFGNRKVGAEFKAVVDRPIGPVLVAGQFGYRVRDEVFVTKLIGRQGKRLYYQQIDDELMYAVGAQYQTPLPDLSLATDLRGTTLAENVKQRFNNPLFWDVGAAYKLPYGLTLTGMLEVGLNAGYGAGHAGFMVGLTYNYDEPRTNAASGEESERSFVTDRDHDGIPDKQDKCPDEPEDYDGFRDSDGCPDPDNDSDGIPDSRDACPNTYGAGTSDGCPLDDADHDGIPDYRDLCPFDPEDYDGFEDEDGCPDPDNDHDGIPDVKDKCPNEPEDFDGFEDEDGCPDPDNDHDGIPDRDDKCPNQAETINGKDDLDGCPDGEALIFDRGDHFELVPVITFEKGGAMLERSSFPALDMVLLALKARAGRAEKLRVVVAPETGKDAKKAQSLAQDRAEMVRLYLTSRGVAATYVEAHAGETPVAPKPAKPTKKGAKAAPSASLVQFRFAADSPAPAASRAGAPAIKH